MKIIPLILSVSAALFCTSSFADGQNEGKKENLMYAWFGDVDQYNPDFVAVIDFDDTSKNYGRLITTSPLSGKNAFGNEPHHAGLIKETKTLVVGGLLSLLSGQDEVFFYDVSSPLTPVFTHSLDVPQSSATDEFINLPNGNVFATMMGGIGGSGAGRIAEFNPQGFLVGEWPATPPTDGFNPHGISINAKDNLMVTTDFVDPASTIMGPIIVQDKVRVWDLAKRQIIRTIALPQAGGTMDIQLIPKDKKNRAIVPGQGGQLWLVDTQVGTVKSVFNFNSIPNQGVAPQPHIVKFNEDGTRMFVSVYGAGWVTMFDATNPENLKLLSTINLGAKSGPHYLRLTQDEKRLVVTDYFLNEHHSNGLVQADGDRKIQVLNVSKNKMVLDTRFKFDGNTAFSTGEARPHAIVFNARENKS